MVVGAATPSGARVVTKVSSSSNVRLAVSLNSGMTSPTFFGPSTPDAQNIATVTATGLAAGTQHWWQIEHGGVLDTSITGKFKTLPADDSVASYTVAVASCAGSSPSFPGIGSVLASSRLSNTPAWGKIRARNPLAFFGVGDGDYYDLSSGLHGIAGGASLANFRRKYDDRLLQTEQHQLLREVSWEELWDDHDFLGNDKRGLEDTTGAANALTVAKERLPHWPLGDVTDGIYRARKIGRVLWVLLDGRSKASANSAADNASKMMLGATQKTWLTNLLAATTAQAVMVLTGSQWTQTTHPDSWASFTTERKEVVGIFRDTGGGWLDRMGMAYGDRHALRIITGANNEHGGFPILMASSLDSTPSAPASGPFEDIPGRGQYGLIRVDDRGQGGITITFTGYAGDTPVMWHSFSTAGRAAIPAGSPSHVLAL